MHRPLLDRFGMPDERQSCKHLASTRKPAAARPVTHQDSFDQPSFRIELSGVAFSRRSSLLDVFCPHTQAYHTSGQISSKSPIIQSSDVNVDHLDISRTWKGISVAQAREVDFWENAFEAAIHSWVETTLLSDFDDSDRARGGSSCRNPRHL